jgi:hypothetical protein
LVSGVDCREDARSFAWLDYDADGWLDIALMGPHAPRFRLFRNRLGEFTAGGKVIELRLEGANRSARADGGSNRDACGAVVTAVTDRSRQVLRRSIGEGLSTQNAGAIRIVVPPGEELQELSVRWPSGRESVQRGDFEPRMRLGEPASPP